MPRKFTEKSLLIASGNAGKVREIRQLLEPFAIEVISAAEFHLQEPEETGSTFIQNAEIKARYYGDATGLPALADDSGLCVRGLDGQPGIYSARWAGESKDFYAAMQRIESELGNHVDRRAHFVCALSLYWPDRSEIETVEGQVHGQLTFPPRGDDGFGYDPIFIPDGYTQTFAEMDSTLKQSLSHRADAFDKLIKTCFR